MISLYIGKRNEPLLSANIHYIPTNPDRAITEVHRDTNANITVTLNTPQAGDILLCLVFDEHGKYIGLQEVTLSGDEITHIFTFEDTTFDRVKVIMLDQSWKPVCSDVKV